MSSLSKLTPRELEIANLVADADGLTNRKIAERLAISPATVKNHLHNIYERLGIHSRFVLVQMIVPYRAYRDAIEGAA